MDRVGKNRGAKLQMVEIELIPAVGISTTLTRSQHENSVIISSLWQRFSRDIHKIVNRPQHLQDYLPGEQSYTGKSGITWAGA